MRSALASQIWRPAEGLPELINLPAGHFSMGEQHEDKFANDTERPVHAVQIRYPFAMSRGLVTVAEFARFDGRMFPADEGGLPVARVSWLDAQAYCEWAGAQCGRLIRLPSEAEWEYACRAGGTEAFPKGSSLAPTEANFLYDEVGFKVGPGQRTPIGNYPPNQFGLYDMHGNLCEWVQDEWHASLDGAPQDGAAWQSSSEPQRRVLRGGAWDYLPRLLRNSWRDYLEPQIRRDNVGFRIAVTLPAE